MRLADHVREDGRPDRSIEHHQTVVIAPAQQHTGDGVVGRPALRGQARHPGVERARGYGELVPKPVWKLAVVVVERRPPQYALVRGDRPVRDDGELVAP